MADPYANWSGPGSFLYSPLDQFIAGRATEDFRTQQNQGQEFGNILPDPYAGMGTTDIVSKYTGGMDPSKWFGDYVGKTYPADARDEGGQQVGYGANNPLIPTLTENGQVRTYRPPEDNWIMQGLKVPAIFLAMIASAGTLGPAAAGEGVAEAGAGSVLASEAAAGGYTYDAALAGAGTSGGSIPAGFGGSAGITVPAGLGAESLLSAGAGALGATASGLSVGNAPQFGGEEFGSLGGASTSGLLGGAAGAFDMTGGAAIPGLAGTEGGFGAGSIYGGASGTGMGLGETLADLWKKYQALTKSPLGTAYNIGSGLYGLMQGRNVQKLAQTAADRQDPFGPQRGQYQQMLADLVRTGDVTKLPGYAAGLEAVNRGMAAGGYLGSGNQVLANAKYGSDLYNQTVQQLGGLAGAGFGPGGAGNTLLQGNISGLQLTGNALNRLGLGLTSMSAS